MDTLDELPLQRVEENFARWSFAKWKILQLLSYPLSWIRRVSRVVVRVCRAPGESSTLGIQTMIVPLQFFAPLYHVTREKERKRSDVIEYRCFFPTSGIFVKPCDNNHPQPFIFPCSISLYRTYVHVNQILYSLYRAL